MTIPVKSLKPSLPFIWDVIAPIRKRVFFVLSLTLVDTAFASIGIGMILPVFQTVMDPATQNLWFSRIIPNFETLSQKNRIIAVVGLTLCVFTGKFLMGIIHVGFTRDFAEKMRTFWCNCIGRQILYGPYSNVIRQKRGVLLNNWLNESLDASKFFLTYMQYLSSLILTVTLFFLGLFVKWQAMMIFVILIGLVLLVLKHYSSNTAIQYSRQKLKLNQKLSASLAESLAHLKDIKIFSIETFRLREMMSVLLKRNALFVRMAIVAELPRLLGEFLAVTTLVLVLLATTFVESFKIGEAIPLLAFFFVATYRLITSGTLAMTARIRAMQEIHSVRLVHNLSQERIEENKGEIPINVINTDIHFNHVTFSHKPDQPLFEDLDLILPRGKLIFLTGNSGAGKSTLLDLLLRLLSPQAGHIIVNNHDINEFDLTAWRSLFGYVSQDSALFHGTVGTNIRLGGGNASDQEMEEVCRLAGCHDFITSLPEGYETLVGEHGLALSGGQRKRIAIARALIGKPQVLILDEVTTSFETEIEQTIIKVLQSERPHLTILQITHRPPTSTHADLILHLEDGKFFQTDHLSKNSLVNGQA